jgi:rod shape-determining protein MreD
MQTSNGVKKILLIFISFYILFLLQASFLVHFNINGWVPNLILIAVILINLFEKPKESLGPFSAIVGGFFSDVSFEPPLNFIGFHILVFFLLSVFIKYFLKRYVQL